MPAIPFQRLALTAALLSYPLVLLAPIASAHADQTSLKAKPSLEGVTGHTLAEFDYLIGTWQCLNTEAGKPDVRSDVRYEWMYGGKVLKETVNMPGYNGEFMTVLDKKNNAFKGVAVDSSGGYVVWESHGMKDDKSSEVGYRFTGGHLVPVSRSDGEHLSDTHYIIRDFGPDTNSGKGAPADTEDCSKIS